MAKDDFGFDSGPEREAKVTHEPPREEPPQEGVPEWMLTYGDMMSLMLCFFVLLAAFSTRDVIKYQTLAGSMRTAFGAASSIPNAIELADGGAIRLGDGRIGQTSFSEDMLERRLTAAVTQSGLTESAALQRTERGLALVLRDTVVFGPASAEVRPEALPLLGRIAEVCRYFPRRVYIDGHTDNLPLQPARYASNWELSSARASAIIRYMLDVEHIAPERFVACGYAGTMPIASNATPNGRVQNRRVEFIFSRGPDD
jgi:chemotaxis protein MotB